MKHKPDIVEFVEKHFAIKLLECQKDMLRKYYSAGPDVQLIYPRSNGYTCFRHLSQAVKEYITNMEDKCENIT